ncbi:MAG TPA: hypothetical protein VMU24_02435 [Candidatus Acidoferrales bacterium]|nr:hypothetical protein [Candidatus Acidoferrales bacterium]
MALISPLAIDQFAAVSRIRWRTLVNSMRSSRGRGELIATVSAILVLLFVSVGPAIGMAFGAAEAVQRNSPALLTVLLWVVFLVSQLFPAISISITEGFDTSSLLRYPMKLGTFGAIWISSGALEPATVVTTAWMVGIAIGVGTTSPARLPWCALVLLVFAAANLLLSRLLMAWFDRLLAKRRAQEIAGIAIVLFSVGVQALGQLSYKLEGAYRVFKPYVRILQTAQGWMPPGAAARALTLTNPSDVSWAMLILCAYIAAFAFLLGVRLRAIYLGENLSEGVHAKDKRSRAEVPSASIETLGFSRQVAAIYEKELRTIFRSGQLILTLLAMPLLLMLLFSHGGRAHLGGTVFGVGAAYSILLLTQLSYNQFGVEQAGVQFYCVAPVLWRQIAIGKNLAHTTILLLQCALMFSALAMFGTVPAPGTLLLTILSVSFAAIANFSAGNVLSFYFPRKVDYARMNRRQASVAAGLTALGVQFVVFGLTIPTFFVAQRYLELWLGVLLFLLLNVGAISIYRAILHRVDAIAARKQDDLIAELSRVA